MTGEVPQVTEGKQFKTPKTCILSHDGYMEVEIVDTREVKWDKNGGGEAVVLTCKVIEPGVTGTPCERPMTVEHFFTLTGETEKGGKKIPNIAVWQKFLHDIGRDDLNKKNQDHTKILKKLVGSKGILRVEARENNYMGTPFFKSEGRSWVSRSYYLRLKEGTVENPEPQHCRALSDEAQAAFDKKMSRVN